MLLQLLLLHLLPLLVPSGLIGLLSCGGCNRQLLPHAVLPLTAIGNRSRVLRI